MGLTLLGRWSQCLLGWQHDLDVTELRNMVIHARLVELHLLNYGSRLVLL